MKPNIGVPLGVFSVLATIGFGLFIKGYLVWAFVCGGGSLLMLSIALFNWLTFQPSPARFKITPCDDLRENDSMPRDIFGRVRIELLEPAEVKIKGYSATYSRNGVVENIPVLNDGDQWVLLDSESLTPRHDPVKHLPIKLRSGHPIEGWIHFRTTKNRYEIESGRLDFFVHTALGDGSAEIPSSSEHWNRTHQNLIMPRP